VLFMDERDSFTLYLNADGGKTLCSNLREAGLHFSKKLGPDFQLVDSDGPALKMFPLLRHLTWYDWDAQPVRKDSLLHRADCKIAVCTCVNRYNAELALFFRSFMHYHPELYLYISTNRNVSERVSREFPTMKTVFDFSLAIYGSSTRSQMEKTGNWLRFSMAKAAVLRRALNDGCKGAWFFDADQRFLSRLPDMTGVPVALTPHRTVVTNYGLFNAGCLFVSQFEPLDWWEKSASEQNNTCCADQTALNTVARKTNWTDPGCGVNVGLFEMHSHRSHNHKNNFHKLTCSNEQIVFGTCKVVSLQVPLESQRGEPLMQYLRAAVQDCHYPKWLAER